MAARLPRRAALLARSTSISTGAIVGATIGSVVGATLIFLCVLPFILRARRMRAFRRQHGEDADVDEFGQPDFLSRSNISDAFRRLSHSTAAQPRRKAYAAGDGQESTDHNADSVDKARTSLYPAGADVNYGLASPVLPTLSGPGELEQLPGRALQNGRTATGSLTLATQTTHDSIPTQILSQGPTMADAETSSKKQSVSDPSAAPSRQGTFGSNGIVEPGSVGLGTKPSRRTRAGHLSDSIRQLAERAAAVLRQDSTLSNGSTRSPPMVPGDDLSPIAPATVVFEPVDTEARGEAYSYYHGFDTPELEPVPLPARSAAYGTPISIPAPLPPSAFAFPTSVSAATPISPGSQVGPSSHISPPLPRPTFGLPDDGADHVYEEPEELMRADLRDKQGLVGPLKRMDTQPLKPIVSDIESPLLPAKSEASVNPMDIWGPTTTTEKDHKTLVELSTPSPPLQSEGTPSMEPFPSQPTPDATPDPEVVRDQDVDMAEEHATPELKQEPSPLDVVLPPPPQIAGTGGDTNMMELYGRYTPPESSIPSNPTTPGYMSEPHKAPGPSMATPSPGSNGVSSDQSDATPRTYRCEECSRVFDQYHKLK